MKELRFLARDISFYGSRATINDDAIGRVSNDRSAVIGRGGWCFIYEGSNNYRGSYLNRDLLTRGDEWARLIEARQKLCDMLGIQFLQIIIPNKLTLLPEYFPEPVLAETSFPLQGLIASKVDANVLIPIRELKDDNVKEYVYRRNDSHLTVGGDAYLVEIILEALGLIKYECPNVETQEIVHIGDLGGKFIPQIREYCHAPLWDNGLLDQRHIVKTSEIIPNNGFNGIEQEFYNNNAAIDKTILVIGNSFFERVPSWGISPFIAALFKKYKFLWKPNLSELELNSYSPDIVVMQTCERFMTVLPMDEFSLNVLDE